MKWKLFKTIMSKKTKSLFDKDKERVDVGLPLNLRIGAMVTLDQTTFILNRGEFGFESPGKDFVVEAYSELSGDVEGHRFFLRNTLNDENAILQIMEDGGMVTDIKIFTQCDEVTPENEADWEDWIGEEGHIGNGVFNIEEDEGSTDYERSWGDSSGWTYPLDIDEKIFADCYGESSIGVSHKAMLYGRDVDGSEEASEYIFLTAEELEESASVQILIGTDIAANELTII